jgi:hypothetical protein
VTIEQREAFAAAQHFDLGERVLEAMRVTDSL